MAKAHACCSAARSSSPRARATEQDETLDRAEVEAMFAGIQPFDEVLRSSGHYGPRVTVPDDADVQTKLIAFTGRQP